MTVISATRSTATLSSRVFSEKDQPRQEVAVRVLLPIDEVFLGQ